MNARPKRILPVIIGSQFAGTSLWFAANAVLGDLQLQWGLPAEMLGHLTSAVQLGFIAGTLVFAFFAIADLFSPRLVFLACSLAGAICNVAPLILPENAGLLLALRFATGFFLAGIYPVGMKIASGWYQHDLGSALGFLVGALVVGTAFPHLVRGLGHALSWQLVMAAISAIAVAGGLLMLLVPDGPFLHRGARFDPSAFRTIFGSPAFRASAFGYFGHMWELYAFWAFVPILLAAHAQAASWALHAPFWSFAAIAAGAVGCVGGGLISLRIGSARVAFAQLAASGGCCLLSPFVIFLPTPLFLAFLLFWGVVVVGDSPQFSALNAQNAPRDRVGSALTIANCIGFAITIPAIQLLNAALPLLGAQWLFLLLAPGPVVGLLALRPLLRSGAA